MSLHIVSGKLTELNNRPASQHSTGVPDLVIKSRQRSGHKAIKETEKPFFKLNSIETKLKTTTVANYRPETHTT